MTMLVPGNDRSADSTQRRMAKETKVESCEIRITLNV